MPNKLTHQKITAATAVLTLPLTLALISTPHSLMILAGHLTTLHPALTPDLDVPIRRLGMMAELVGFKAYAQNVSHRSGTKRKHWKAIRGWQDIGKVLFFSHLPFIGTLPRTFIVTFPATFFLLLFPQSMTMDVFILWYICPWIGMGISDLAHVIADAPWKRSAKKDKEKIEMRYKMKKPH